MAKQVVRVRQNRYIFQTFHSPFSGVAQINQGRVNIVADWNRPDAGPIRINGYLLEDLVKKEKKSQEPIKPPFFRDEEELKAFLKKYLLKDIVDSRKKNEALEKIITILHQDGLLRPVSATALVLVSHKSNSCIGPIDVRAGGQVVETNFISTPQGFKVQEILSQKEMSYTINAGELAGEKILPDPGQTYIYKAQATIDVDFSKAKPSFSIESNTISYGNNQIKNLLDGRNLFAKFIDYLKGVLGLQPDVENLGAKSCTFSA